MQPDNLDDIDRRYNSAVLVSIRALLVLIVLAIAGVASVGAWAFRWLLA